MVDTELLITSFRTTGTQFIGNPAEWNGVPVLLGVDRTKNDYRDVLPSLNVSFDVTDDMKIRGAYSETVSRQDLPDDRRVSQGSNRRLSGGSAPFSTHVYLQRKDRSLQDRFCLRTAAVRTPAGSVPRAGCP